jgi:hypothetical protein
MRRQQYRLKPSWSIASELSQPVEAIVLMNVSYLLPITLPQVKQRTGMIIVTNQSRKPALFF